MHTCISSTAWNWSLTRNLDMRGTALTWQVQSGLLFWDGMQPCQKQSGWENDCYLQNCLPGCPYATESSPAVESSCLISWNKLTRLWLPRTTSIRECCLGVALLTNETIMLLAWCLETCTLAWLHKNMSWKLVKLTSSRSCTNIQEQ